MLALYPSNKLEHLSFLLTTLLKQQPTAVFTPETILVESPGMQHWVSMQLAREQGVAMNIDFPLPVRFMWNTARTVLGKDKVPKQSAYRREVLAWRIDNILQNEEITQSHSFKQVNHYWKRAGNEVEQGVQRLQLATALADVYEQYLLYRPDWLFAWESNQAVVHDDMEIWQSEIWRLLVKEQPLHPAKLHKMTIESLASGVIPQDLPSRVIVFAINTMAPQLIAFFDALAQHIDVHIFHLNPSVNYWGDAKNNAQQAKQLRQEGLARWMHETQSNPLLGNLGQQGRELFNLLTALDTFEISAFDAPKFLSSNQQERLINVPSQASELTDETAKTAPLLDYIHDDILQAKAPHPVNVDNDDSIAVMCTHSALREVQVLHDHLLHWLSQDNTRTPSDILVMCPAIENYAPFVDAVFHRVGTRQIGDVTTTRLPCSIADRSPMDAEPLIAAYMALLHLPDSRFGVSDIMDYLQLDAVQKKFALTQDDIDQMVAWLKQAHIHWGLSGEHKAVVSEGVTNKEIYSWWWGLNRLLTGMLAPDSEMVINGVLTIPDVEGQGSLTLGKLIEVVQLLGQFASELTTPRTPKAWASTLLALRDACFTPTREQEQSWDLIAKVAADLAARCEEASYESELSLRQIRELLLNRFSSPDAGNHFVTGQVTVCSMLPMRSIPFKKVCILGLNDSEFPRKSTPLGLDLMAKSTRRVGDRSRRLEDRYLFLEAIISARESLYLSYQGNSVTNNSERQPSLVLAEFLEMLELEYQVPLSCIVTHAPLHPFSESGFVGMLPSYDKGWLRLADALQKSKDTHQQGESELCEGPLNDAQANTDTNTRLLIKDDELNSDVSVSAMQIARAFADPLAYFSSQRLGVDLSQSMTLLENSEPFETNALIRYQIMDAIFSSPQRTLKDIEAQHDNLNFGERVIEYALLRGDIPQNPVAKNELEMWKEGALALNQAMGPHDAEPKTASFRGRFFTFTASVFEGSDALVELCAGKISDTRALGYFITQLIFSSTSEGAKHKGFPLDVFFCDWVKGETKLMKRRFQPFEPQIAEQLLLFIEQLYLKVYSEPTPLFSSLFSEIVPGKRKSASASIVAEIKPERFAAIVQAAWDESPYSNAEIEARAQENELAQQIQHAQQTQPVKQEEAEQIVRDIDDFIKSEEAVRGLTSWQQSSGQFGPDIANNSYVKWLFPQGVSWGDLPSVQGFILFSMVANAAVEETL